MKASISPLYRAVTGNFSETKISTLPENTRIRYFCTLYIGIWDVKSEVNRCSSFKTIEHHSKNRKLRLENKSSAFCLFQQHPTAWKKKKLGENRYPTSRLCMNVMVFRVVTRCSLVGVINPEYGNLYFHLCENLKSHIAWSNTVPQRM